MAKTYSSQKEQTADQIMDFARDRLTQAMPYFNRAFLYMPVIFYEPKRAGDSGTESHDVKNHDEISGQTAAEGAGALKTSSDIGGYMKDLPAGIGTNGTFIYADPDSVTGMFRESPKLLVRTYLHVIFHCLFSHPFQYLKLDKPVWDLAADAAVENAVLECDLKGLELPDDWTTRDGILRIKGMTGEEAMAEKIYKWAEEHPGKREELLELAPLFHRDIHDPWALEDHLWKEMIIRRGGDSDGQKWRTISSGVQRDMESYEKNLSVIPGGLKKVFRERFKKSGSYTDFLKKFARLTEEIHINNDEFDYIYYTYGLRLYRNMPLIEPLEYRETDKIRDFVIALDTSGSCQGYVIRNFLHRTWDVIKSSGTFSDQINLHIIQCDSQVQSDRKITNEAEFDDYMSDIEISGSGGTDFQPVFSYVDQLIKRGDLSHMRGLLYFTDGYGAFPADRPRYKTAFVFVRDRFEIPKVPPWAMRVVLEPDDIR